MSAYMSSQQDTLIREGSNHLEKDSNSCLISSAAGRIHEYMRNDQLHDQAIVGASSVISQYTDSVKQLCDSLQVTLSEQQAAPCEGMMLTSENTDGIEELNQGSPKKKRQVHVF